MDKHQITVERDDSIQGFMSTQSVATDALNALSNIPGVSDPDIIDEHLQPADRITVSFSWDACQRQFETTNEHLAKFGLRRVP